MSLPLMIRLNQRRRVPTHLLVLKQASPCGIDVAHPRHNTVRPANTLVEQYRVLHVSVVAEGCGCAQRYEFLQKARGTNDTSQTCQTAKAHKTGLYVEAACGQVTPPPTINQQLNPPSTDVASTCHTVLTINGQSRASVAESSGLQDCSAANVL